MDQLRHINNVTYVDYLQEARIDFFRALEIRVTAHDAATTGQGGEEAEQEPYGIVVVRHEITYLAPLHFGFAPVSIETFVTEVRAASFSLGYEIFHQADDGSRTVYLRATSRLAPFVFGSERPRRLTAAERAAITPYVEEPAEHRPRATGRAAAPIRKLEIGRYPVAVRFSDLDPYGHVNNVTYLEYFQEGRIRLNSALWRDLPEGTPHTGVVVAQADIDYLRPMLSRPDGYDLWSWVSSVGNRSMVMESLICEPGTDTVMSRCRVVLVFFDSAAGRSVEPPAGYRDPLCALVALGDQSA